MSRITTVYTNQEFDNGVLVSSTPIVVDITRDYVCEQLRVAMKANRVFIASTPTADQVTAQVKALSMQMNRLIRLVEDTFDGSD